MFDWLSDANDADLFNGMMDAMERAEVEAMAFDVADFEESQWSNEAAAYEGDAF